MHTNKIHLFSERSLITLILFLTGSLHTLIFTFFQLPDNTSLFLWDGSEIPLKAVSYLSAIGSTFLHRPFTKRFGLRAMLMSGLWLNFIGLSALLMQFQGIQAEFLSFLSSFCFGLSLLTVINSLVSYLILEYPKHIDAGLILLFIFLNSGVMLSPLILNLFRAYHAASLFILSLLILVIIAQLTIRRVFQNPSIPHHLHHSRKSSSLWKDMHIRLALFIIALVFYGALESTFSLWGEVLLAHFIPVSQANLVITLFWLFMIVGQILVLFPLYYLNPRVIFTALALVTLIALWGLKTAQHPTTLIAMMILGGIGCSALFPLLLSSMSNQIVKDSSLEHTQFLPYIELATSYLLAGYVLGLGSMDFWHTLRINSGIEPYRLPFICALLFSLALLLLYLFLSPFLFKEKRTDR